MSAGDVNILSKLMEFKEIEGVWRSWQQNNHASSLIPDFLHGTMLTVNDEGEHCKRLAECEGWVDENHYFNQNNENKIYIFTTVEIIKKKVIMQIIKIIGTMTNCEPRFRLHGIGIQLALGLRRCCRGTLRRWSRLPTQTSCALLEEQQRFGQPLALLLVEQARSRLGPQL